MRISRILPSTMLIGGLLVAATTTIVSASADRHEQPSGFRAAGAELANSLPAYTSARTPLGRAELAALHQMAAARVAAEAKAVARAVPPGVHLRPAWPLSEALARLRHCEASGNYGANTGNGYYGAYQFDLRTWRGLGLSGLPSVAPPAVQDAAAATLQAKRGWSPWPACSARLGLR